MLPEEITRPTVEHVSTDAAEFSPLSDEFFQRAAPADPPKKKRKPIQLAAGVMAAVVVVNAFVGLPLAQIKAPTESPTGGSPIVETAPPTTPPTEPPFEMVVLEPYQNFSDTCIITVYADYFDVAAMGNPILMEQTVQESTFTELALPERPNYEGYSVLGYVIEYSSSSSNFTNVGYNPGSKSFAVPEKFPVFTLRRDLERLGRIAPTVLAPDCAVEPAQSLVFPPNRSDPPIPVQDQRQIKQVHTFHLMF